MKPTWISTHRQMNRAICRNWNVEKFVKVRSGHDFVVLGAHMRVLTPINGCHSNAKFA